MWCMYLIGTNFIIHINFTKNDLWVYELHNVNKGLVADIYTFLCYILFLQVNIVLLGKIIHRLIVNDQYSHLLFSKLCEFFCFILLVSESFGECFYFNSLKVKNKVKLDTILKLFSVAIEYSNTVILCYCFKTMDEFF